MTNLSYAQWILGSFFLSFYSSILPVDPAYDFIHLKNYFLLTTLIVIISQDIYFYRNKKSFEKKLNAFMVKNSRPKMQGSLSTDTAKLEKISKFTDNISDDEMVFDVRNYKNKDELNIYQYDLKEDRVPEESEGNDLVYRQKRINFFLKNNENFLFITFGIILGAQFLISTIVMVQSVAIPFYRYITLFIHFLIILISCISNYLSVNFFQNQNA